MRLLVTHRSSYRYPSAAALGPHVVRLRPATHTKAKIETYTLEIEQPSTLRWQQDPAGNHVARLSFRAGERVPSLDITVEMAVDVRPVNPFDFFLDPRCERVPFRYPDAIAPDLGPYLEQDDIVMHRGERLTAFLEGLPREGQTIDLLVALNQAVNRRVRYVIREEHGIYTPEETLARGEASCRDSAVLLVAALRSRGLAARFVSGYLIQLTDEGMIPDEPRGVGRDVVDLHAWAEVYLPGAGWVGLDATSGLLCGEGHIPLACTARPAAAAPIEGTSDVAATDVRFEMRVARLGHEPRPTAPYTEETWEALLAGSDRIDDAIANAGLELTVGGEPTFTSRLHPEKPEWNGAAVGETKLPQALALASALKKRLAPGGVVLHGFGKHYPGESLPRWALDVVARRDGTPLSGDAPLSDSPAAPGAAESLVSAIAKRLELEVGLAQPAFEDPWHYVREEARLPVGVDPHDANLGDPEDRRRLALLLDRGLKEPSGWVLPLAPLANGGWASARWTFRRERLYLVPGDSPIGLRLPLGSIEGGGPPEPTEDRWDGPPDPRRPGAEEEEQARREGRQPPSPARATGIRTALCVELRNGSLWVFLPPQPSAASFCELVRKVGEAARDLGVPVHFEGYPPPKSPDLFHFAITPDPGVIEVNLPPMRRGRDHYDLMSAVFDAALGSGLSAEKYQLDGRQAGSGGGHHITLGGPVPLASPFLRRPDILASLLTFVQHHPSLSYLFNGLFVGPTSQSPRVDEARHETLYELEIAMAKAFEPGEAPPPWLADALFRHLLVDLTGNTHRAEVCIDKLFDPQTAYGRQGIIELRAFEMPPHARMTLAQVALVRGLVASFARAPYRRPLTRWGSALHDRFLLPTWLWRDFEDVLAHLEQAGLTLPAEAYRVFLELRCPVIGTLAVGDVTLELRNAIEPWNVLGEELTATGTARFVDSSMERVEVRATGLVPERHRIIVNGLCVPLRPTGAIGEHVGGVRFRAWAPAHSLHGHIGVHHPLRFELLDTWGRRSLGACAYHVWHPEGRAFDVPPLTRFEAAARRAQRFTVEGPTQRPVRAAASAPHPEAPYTIDLRRYAMDHPMPEPFEEQEQ